ncbi:hypothetical protein HY605_03730 [Candidatus Peregrinibacteria bacterium]|nr:hypothetical protein [Candidatus Peregrinibacteria bacterium]
MQLNGYFANGSPMLDVKIGDGNNIINFLIDTGFDRELMLSKKNIEELNLKYVGDAEYITAKGDTALSEVYVGNIEWFGERKYVMVLSTEADFNLLGMELLHNSRVVIERHRNILSISKS